MFQRKGSLPRSQLAPELTNEQGESKCKTVELYPKQSYCQRQLMIEVVSPDKSEKFSIATGKANNNVVAIL
jgi:hypothetical protein